MTNLPILKQDNNINLKQNHKQMMMRQIIKCKRSAIYFLKKYCYIVLKTGQKTKFNLWQFQEAVVNQLQNNDLNIILKSRQMGISTLASAYALWYMMFQDYKNICVIANKQRVASNIIKKASLTYGALPMWLQQYNKTIKNNPLSMQFSNGSKIFAEAATDDAGRSEAVSLLIIDEMAIIKPRMAQQIWLAAQPTISNGGQAILLSTPKGCGNVYHKLWTEAIQGINGLNPIQLQWYLRPDRDVTWYKKERAKYGAKGFAQQYQCSFQASGDNVIDMDTIKWYQQNYMMEPVAKEEANRLWIFKYPQQGKTYIISADVARGDGQDFSAFHVIQVDNLEQVAQFKGKINTKEYAQLIHKWAKLYFDAMVVVENASIGWAVLQHLIDRQCKNIYYTQKDVPVVQKKTMKYVSKPTDSKKGVPGFTTSSKTRPLILQKLSRFIQQQVFIIRSKRLLTQLVTFIWTKNGRAEAMYGFNDDLVISGAIGIWVRQTAIKARQTSRRRTRELFKLSGKTKLPSISSGYQQKQQWMIQLGDGTIIDTRI